jgi:hypothetical protein
VLFVCIGQLTVGLFVLWYKLRRHAHDRFGLMIEFRQQFTIM